MDSTDHTRENTPLLVAGIPDGPVDLGVRATFGDLGATVAELLGVETSGLAGTSFVGELGY
jgi:phosphopentomutase